MAAEYKSGFLSNYSLSELEQEEHNMYSRYRMFFEYDISSYFSNVLIFTSIQAIHANPGSAIYAAESCFKACIHKYIRLNPRIKSYVFYLSIVKDTGLGAVSAVEKFFIQKGITPISKEDVITSIEICVSYGIEEAIISNSIKNLIYD